MKQVSDTNALACFLFAILLSGCANNTSIPYQSFDRIEINTVDYKISTYTVPSKGESAATGVVAGAFGGLTVSFLSSLICGPYFALCFAVTAPATIGATALVGGVMGLSGFSDEDAAEIIPYLETLQATHNINQELATALAEQLPASSLVPPGVADARISLDVNDLRLEKLFGQKLVLSMSVVTRYEWRLNKQSPHHSKQKFLCSTRPRPIDELQNEDGVTFEQELDFCIEDLARQISKALTAPPPKPVDGFPDIDQ